MGRCVPLAVLLAMGVCLAPDVSSEARSAFSAIGRPVSAVADREWMIARSLRSSGSRPGAASRDRAREPGLPGRLARVQIVAEVHADGGSQDFESVPESDFRSSQTDR